MFAFERTRKPLTKRQAEGRFNDSLCAIALAYDPAQNALDAFDRSIENFVVRLFDDEFAAWANRRAFRAVDAQPPLQKLHSLSRKGSVRLTARERRRALRAIAL